MREHALHRTPFVENGDVVGIVTLGDHAVDRDPTSASSDISASGPNT